MLSSQISSFLLQAGEISELKCNVIYLILMHNTWTSHKELEL